MAAMAEEEIRGFLEEGTRTGKLAVTRKDGSPLVVPIWFCVDDDGSVVFTTGADTVKGRSLLRDGRVSLCVDDERAPYAFVRIDGTVEISEHPGDLLAWATRIGGRYMGAALAEQYGRRNGVPGELLVRIIATRVRGEANVAG